MTAFIIANGTSRVGFDLRLLSEAGVIYGCNAIYRTNPDDVDFVVAIDDGIIREIEQSDYESKKVIIPPEDERWEPFECNAHRPRSNAGMNAMREAIKRGAKTIIGLGFDFMLIDESQSISNIYDGTKNYGMGTRAHASDNIGRASYLDWLAKTNPSVDFILCYKTIQSMHRMAATNISVITYDQLKESL